MGFKKRSSHKPCKELEEILIEDNSIENVTGINFSEYSGQVVTVFVNGNGTDGKGFTGILLEYTDSLIKLLIMPSTRIACSLGNSCSIRNNTDNILACASCPYNSNHSMGAIAEIPINNIVAFIHNNI